MKQDIEKTKKPLWFMKKPEDVKEIRIKNSDIRNHLKRKRKLRFGPIPKN